MAGGSGIWNFTESGYDVGAPPKGSRAASSLQGSNPGVFLEKNLQLSRIQSRQRPPELIQKSKLFDAMLGAGGIDIGNREHDARDNVRHFEQLLLDP